MIGEPEQSYTQALCEDCDTAVHDIADGVFQCIKGHVTKIGEVPEEKLPYTSWADKLTGEQIANMVFL